MTLEEIHDLYYSKNYYRDRIRETLRWPVVWLVAANDASRREEVLRMKVWEFLESALWSLDKITKEIQDMPG